MLHNGEWWFSVIDVVEVLTGSSIPKRYWSDLKKKLVDEGFTETYEKIVRLKMLAPDGKMRLTDCAEMILIALSHPMSLNFSIAQVRQYQAVTLRSYNLLDSGFLSPI